MLPRILFREQALRHHTSPEELDRPLRLIRPRAWVALLGFAGLCAAAVGWAVLGRVPETVEGAGVLVARGSVRVLESPFDGVFTRLHVHVGKVVKKGDPVAEVYQGETERQLAQARLSLEELRLQDVRQRGIEKAREESEAALRKSRGEILDESITAVEKLIAELRSRSQTTLKARREQIEKSRQQLREHGKTLRDRLASARRLQTSRLVTGETVLAAESALLQNEQQIAELDSRVGELDLKDLDIRQSVLLQQGKLAELQVQRRELGLQAIQTRQEHARNQATREALLRDQEERVKLLTARLSERQTVLSPVSGRILEVSVQPGQTAAPGSRIGLLEQSDSPGEGLRVVAYFTVGHGKRIVEGMPARVTPSTVQRERYGSIVGKVTRVSAYPVTEQSAAAGVGNPEVVQGLRRPGGAIEVEVELERGDTPSGYRWTSAGPPTTFTPGTTAAVRVTVEERAPISYLLPMVRGWLQGARD